MSDRMHLAAINSLQIGLITIASAVLKRRQTATSSLGKQISRASRGIAHPVKQVDVCEPLCDTSRQERSTCAT
jgi:hypothetical protein